MLQSIREYTQGWIAGIIISIIILTFALWGIHSYFTGSGNSNLVAEVNGVEITKDQLSAAYQRLQRQVMSQPGSNPLKDEAALKERALQAIIDLEVLKQSSMAQGYFISNRQIDGYLQNMAEFQVNGQFSVERFQEVLSSAMLSTGEFIDIIKTSLLIDQPKLGIIYTSFALPDETETTISLINQEREIEFLKIPLAFGMSRIKAISQEQIQQYYKENQQRFMTPEQVTVEYVELKMNDLSGHIQPNETMLRNFYNENLNAYTQPMKWRLVDVLIPLPANATEEETAKAEKSANEAMQALNNNEDIAKIRKDYGSGQLSQDWLSLSEMPSGMQGVVSNLTKSGDVSDPVKINAGIVVIKAIDIKQAQINAFESVKDKVKEAYIRQHAEEKFAELREQLANLAYEHPDSLQTAAETLDLKIQKSESFTKKKASAGIGQYKKVRQAAFSDDVLELKNNSDVIQIAPGEVLVLRTNSHESAALLPLDSVSKQIQEDLRRQAANEELAKFANELTERLNKGSDYSSLVRDASLQWKKLGYIGRYATKVDPAILELAFRIPHPQQTGKAAYGAGVLADGYVVVAVKSVKDGSIANKKQYTIFAEQVQNSEGLLEYELYRQSQLNNANIKVM